MAGRRPPVTIVIGPISFSLTLSTEDITAVSEEMGMRVLGVTDLDKSSITMAEHLSLDMERVIVVHECLHAMFYPILHGLDGGQEEVIVDQLSFQIVKWMRDNPALMRYLTS